MRTIVLVVLSALLCVVALAGEPPSEPILRMETGTHTDAILQIGVDAKEQYLVSCSIDKTVRLWSLPELLGGSLKSNPPSLSVYRVPIGSGFEGALNAVAISPNGKQIACGGATGGQWDDGSACVYIFDRGTGAIVKRLTGLSSVTELQYSPNGRHLAAGMAWGGTKVWDVSRAYAEVSSDSVYASSVRGLAFSSDGKLVTSCYDGSVRIYDTSFECTEKVMASTAMPRDVSFSETGQSVAVGFFSRCKVDVLSGSNLSSVFSLNTQALEDGNLSEVSWSKDGSGLFAGGFAYDSANAIYPVFFFPNSGRGKPISLGGARRDVTDIVALTGKKAVFSSADPALGYVGLDKRSSVIYPSIVGYEYQNLLSLSTDGKTVGFGYGTREKEPAFLDVSNAMLQLGSFSAYGLARPIQESAGINVTDWRHSYEPKLNGKRLKLEDYEQASALAITPGLQSFILGTTCYVWCFSKSGAENWKVATPSRASDVVVSRDGKLCVAAFGDGTIRWFRMTDGKELLAFFPHADKKRWVLWTPAGYYNCSVGGEDILGWHVNNGKDRAADFFPASRFRDKYYRPDIVCRVLDTLDEDEAMKLANAEAGRERDTLSAQTVLDARPPVVTILSPNQGFQIHRDTVTISYSVRSPSGEPVTKIKILVDGRPSAEEPGLTFTSANGGVKRTTEVKLPSGECKVTVLAENKYAVGEPAIVTINRKAAGLATTPGSVAPKANLYVVAIGISEYASSDIPRLKYAAKDATDFLAAISAQKGMLYANVKSRLLTNKDAKRSNIIDALEWLNEQTTNKDVAVLFVSGHGANDVRGDYYYLPEDFDRSAWQRTGLLYTEFQLTMTRVPGKAVLFVDTCDSGNVMGGTARGTEGMTKALNELISAENGIAVFTASSSNQVSLENSVWQNGAFTKALIEGLNGRADLLKKGKVTCSSLNVYVSDRVEELTRGRQSPNFSLPRTVTDFPLAVVSN